MSDRPARSFEQTLPSSSGCFVCGRDNARGLGVRFRRTGELEVAARVSLPGHVNGFPGRSHGGIVASLLDEAMGWATVLANGCFTYTVELSVRYREPVPLETPLDLSGAVSRHTRRLTYATAQIRSPNGALLASGEGKFLAMPAADSRQIAEALLYDAGDWRPQSER